MPAVSLNPVLEKLTNPDNEEFKASQRKKPT